MPEPPDDLTPRQINLDEESARARYPLEKFTQRRTRPRVSEPDTVQQQAGRMPPQAVDVEQAVLGAMLIAPEAIPQAIEVLSDEAFYQPKHQKVYRAMLSLFERGNPVDLITLTDELKRRGELDDVGGAYYLTELTARVASAANVEHHARIIAEKSLVRQMIEVMTRLVGVAYDPGTDAFDLLDEAERDIFRISESQLRKSSRSMSDVVKETIERLQSIHGMEGGITGVPSGFTRLDDMTSGWQPSDMVIIAARPSMGKCLGKGTRVMMYDGTLRPVEDIRVGDLVMGDDSTPRRVLSLARGREEMVWVRQTYGIDYRVNASHILSVKKSRSGTAREPRGTVTDISVRDFRLRSAKWQNDHKGYKVAVDFPERDLPVEPYFLGLWLGDGKSDSARIYTQDEEVADYLYGLAEARGEHVSVYDADRCPAYLVTGGRSHAARTASLQADLRTLGVLGNKHIPHAYLTGSRSQRLSLLAGLIDSDGHRNAGHGGTLAITQANKRLAEQIKFLCDTLGYRTSIKARTVRSQTGRVGTAWRVRFNGNVSEIPTRVVRKTSPPWSDIRDWTMSGLTLESDGVGDYYGFELDGNRRFLLEDGTVTHNTAFSLAVTRNAALHPTKPCSVAYFSLEMSAGQLAQRLLTSEARIDAQKARTGRLSDEDWPNLARAAGRLAEAKIFIDDTPGLGVLELRAKCRRLKAEHDIGLVIVDYLQLMHGPKGSSKSSNREQEIAAISRSMKSLAKELDVPVIALSQLSRAVETRGGDKRPMLSDLRESGCLTGDTLVTLAGSGRRVPIRELAARHENGGFDVWALDCTTYRIGASQASRAFSTGVKPVFKLTTASGRTIRATANHKFLSFDGWKRLDELTTSDRLALPRTIASTKDKATLSLDELALLGHLIGDGCTLPRHAVQYTTREPDLANHVAELARNIFGDDIAPRISNESPSTRQTSWFQVYLTSTRQHTHGTRNAIAEWLDTFGAWGLRSYEKRVPGRVFEQPVGHIAHFLRHLWATDGCIRLVAGRSPRAAIYYATSSVRLGHDVQALLLRLGINARIKRVRQPGKGRDQYHVIVSGKPEVLAFASRVGAVGQYKQESLAAVENMVRARPGNTNRDVIPRSAWETLVRPARKTVGLSERAFQAAIGTAYCGSSLYRSAMSRTRAGHVADVVESEPLRHLAQSDVYWDPVASIEPDGVEEVFDLTVPGPHNFEANGLIVHNSIEQDADVVMFIYRAERYGITVDENGNSTEGLAEIIIGKQRNGPIGNVNLAFVNQYARFENLTQYYTPPGGDAGFGPDDAAGFGPPTDNYAPPPGDGFDSPPGGGPSRPQLPPDVPF